MIRRAHKDRRAGTFILLSSKKNDASKYKTGIKLRLIAHLLAMIPVTTSIHLPQKNLYEEKALLLCSFQPSDILLEIWPDTCFPDICPEIVPSSFLMKELAFRSSFSLFMCKIRNYKNSWLQLKFSDYFKKLLY